MTPEQIQGLRDKIIRGEATLEEAHAAILAIRKTWTAQAAATKEKEKTPRPVATPKAPKAAEVDFF